MTEAKHAAEKHRLAALPAFLLMTLLFVRTAYALEPEEAPVRPPWKLRAELSYVSTSGNTDTETLAAKLDTKKEGPVNRYFANGSYLRAEDSGAETSNKLRLEGRVERVLTERFFALFAAGYSRDKFSGYDFRAWAGPGGGYDFVRSDAHKLTGLLSLLYNRDEFSRGAAARDDYPTAKATAKYEYRPRWASNRNLTFKETLEYFTSLEKTEKWFLDSITGVEVRVNGHLSLGASYTLNYQNAPPSPELDNTDTTFLTTLIIDY